MEDLEEDKESILIEAPVAKPKKKPPARFAQKMENKEEAEPAAVQDKKEEKK